MRNQDPLKPVSDTEFIAQMAQFTSLEQTKEMSSDVQELRQSYALTQGTNLLGKTVKIATGENENQVFTKGIVTDLEVNKDGDVSLIVNNQAHALDSVIAVNSGILKN
jgi:flagellar basal-body rod modification protein FlgD